MGGARGGTQAETRQTERGLRRRSQVNQALGCSPRASFTPTNISSEPAAGMAGLGGQEAPVPPKPKGQSSFFALLLFCSPWLLPSPAPHAPEHTGCIAVAGTAGWGWASASCTWGPCRAGLSAVPPSRLHANMQTKAGSCHLAATYSCTLLPQLTELPAAQWAWHAWLVVASQRYKLTTCALPHAMRLDSKANPCSHSRNTRTIPTHPTTSMH